MRLVTLGCAVSLSLALSGCSSTPPPPPPGPALPPNVCNGVGSQYGSYAAQEAGETQGATGERCVVYEQDQPLTQAYVLRVKSQSCESPDRPGWMIATDISRTVIPIGQSALKDEPPGGCP